MKTLRIKTETAKLIAEQMQGNILESRQKGDRIEITLEDDVWELIKAVNPDADLAIAAICAKAESAHA